MKLMEINWQEKYLQQIHARLEALGQDLRELKAEMLAGFARWEEKHDRLETKMDAGFARSDEKYQRLDAKMDAGFARLDEKMDAGLREVRRLQWGTLALIAGAVLAAVIRDLA